MYFVEMEDIAFMRLRANVHTVWLEILAGIYFGGLVKFLYLAEFTWAVWQSLCHNAIHSKMANPDVQS